MSKKNKEKATKKKENQRIRFLSPDSYLYKSSATIILRGKSETDKEEIKPTEEKSESPAIEEKKEDSNEKK